MSDRRNEPFIMPAAQAVPLPGRDPRFPVMYQYEEHPLVPSSGKHGGRIYVFLHDTSEKANLNYYAFAKGIIFPEGTEEAVTQAGYLKLNPGDYVLARDVHGSGEAEDDHPVVWVTGGDVLPDGMEKSLEDHQQDILGPDELMDAEKARKVDGVWCGGILWERSDYAVNIAASERCYTNAQSYQIQRNLTPPAVGEKVYSDPTEHHELRKKIIQTAAPVALASLQRAPAAYIETMKIQAEVNNTPRIGTEDNVVLPTMQLNIASTKSHDALAADHFSRDLGQFAGKHVDEHDSAGAYTCMISMNRLSENDRPGFFMANIGVAIEQRGIITTCFSGLHFHGGFPPTAPPGQTPDKTSYRCVIVCYPPCAPMDGDSMIGFGALPEGKLFSLPPEMTNTLFDNQTFSTNNANWLSEGLTLTSDQAFLNWYYRSLCQMIHFFTWQIPASGRPSFDVAKFRQCLTMQPMGDRAAALEPDAWPLAPGIDDLTAAAKRWEAHKDRVSSFIPHVVHARHEKAEREKAEKEREERAKRDKRSKGGANRAGKEPALKHHREDDKDGDEERPRFKKTKRHAHDGRAHRSRPVPLKKRKSRRKALPSPDEAGSDADVEDAAEQSEPPRKRRRKLFIAVRSVLGHRASAPIQISSSRHWATLEKAVAFDLSDDDESGGMESEDGVMPEATKCGLPHLPECSDQSDSERSELEDESLDTHADHGSAPNSAVALFDPTCQPAAAPDMHKKQVDLPCYQKVLDSFSEANLNQVLSKYKAMALKTPSLPGFDSDIDTFLVKWRAQTPGTISRDFAQSVSRMWRVHEVRASTADFFELNIALERRRLMLCNAAAWTWLTVSCVDAASAIVARLGDKQQATEDTSSDWLERLV
ncbi:hypothetical protein C8T65DRAFT_751241 [Cerioporus squamosus]|nr:hypothetical protein C8T65DRAFT_751241 [Cerioporus squamosus]